MISLKVWKYKQGSLFGMARAHSGPISKVTYSPSGKHIAAITKHGAIVIWEFWIYTSDCINKKRNKCFGIDLKFWFIHIELRHKPKFNAEILNWLLAEDEIGNASAWQLPSEGWIDYFYPCISRKLTLFKQCILNNV